MTFARSRRSDRIQIEQRAVFGTGGKVRASAAAILAGEAPAPALEAQGAIHA
jgi:hypothetical protein